MFGANAGVASDALCCIEAGEIPKGMLGKEAAKKTSTTIYNVHVATSCDTLQHYN